ncbi:MAG: sulfatase-like hydrolase/transferase [Rikenellaceae bacterium]
MKSRFLALLGVVGATQALAVERPNIIFILADDMGYGDVSCFNDNKLVMTPNIDRLAKRGVRMTQAYVYPVSAPTRASFLTGSQGHEIGVYGNSDSDVPGVGQERNSFTPELQKLGYSTAWFGKWHQGYDVASHPLNNGFDRAYGFLGGMHDYYDAKEGNFYNGGPYSQYAHIYDDFTPVKQMGYITEEVTQHAIDFIEENLHDPFYIYLAYNAPHTPLQAPEETVLKYLRQGCDAISATRYAMIDVMDAQIGLLLNTLKENEIDENTLVIFMSDNGPELEVNSGGYRGHKFTLWEGGVRTPLIASLPGVIPQGIESNSMCGIYDMATTILTLANGEATSFGTGKDLMPYFKRERVDNVRDSFIIANHPNNHRMPYTHSSMNLLLVRMGEWKYVKDVALNELALYNIESDPSERENLYDMHPEIVKELLEYADQVLETTPISSAMGFQSHMSKTREQAHITRYKQYE